MSTLEKSAPIAVGGVGGSGTRLLAQVLTQLGVAMPGPQNAAMDNLWFTLLFKRRSALVDVDEEFAALLELFLCRLNNIQHTADGARALVERFARIPRQTHSIEQMQGAAQSFLAPPVGPALETNQPFGWKEPNTHVCLERLLRACPGLRYIHMMRHGIDMAFSANQNQLRLSGPIFLERPVSNEREDSLAYWCAAHRRLDRISAKYPGRVLTVKFEDLCRETGPIVESLCDFLGLSVTGDILSKINDDCSPPPSVGRYKAASLDAFSGDDVEYVVSKGYAID